MYRTSSRNDLTMEKCKHKQIGISVITRAEEGSFEWYGQVQQFFNKMVGKVNGSKGVCIAHN